MKKQKHVMVFTADVHGNEEQYRRLVDYAVRVCADSVVIGGDIAPKGASTDAVMLGKTEMTPEEFIDWQRRFLEERLPELLQPLREADIPVFVMMGNDDCRINEPVLEDNGYRTIHGRRVHLTRDIDIAGYSCVPLTRFQLKDWEKFDFSQPPDKLRHHYEERKKRDYNCRGVHSQLGGIVPVSFGDAEEMDDSIQKDLKNGVYGPRSDKTVYVMHSPPDNTALDQLRDGTHVGSLAIREFIEEAQPLMTLHGHIHETVDVSGTFREKIGETHCFSAGNDNTRRDLAVVVVDIYKPEEAKRIVI